MKLGVPLILGVVLLTTACGPLVQIGGNAEPPASLLTIASTAPPPAATRGDPVLIAMPSVPGKLQTLRVPVTTTTNEIKYLGRAAWIEQPNRLFQRVLAAQFAAVTNRPAVDERTPDVVPAARLSGTLTEFGLDVSGGSEVVVAYDAVLTSSSGGFVGSQHFEARRPATQETGPAVAAALAEAANEVAASAAAWAAQGL